MSAVDVVTVQTEGTTLAKLVWRKFKRQPPGLVERILMADPALGDLGPFLPVGTVVTIPVDDEARQGTAKPVISLWD